MPSRAFTILRDKIKTISSDEIDVRNLIQENPDVINEKYGSQSLLTIASWELSAIVANNSIFRSTLRLKEISKIRDIMTCLLEADAIPTESDISNFISTLRLLAEWNVFPSTRPGRSIWQAPQKEEQFLLNSFKKLTTEFLKKGMEYTPQERSEYRPITSAEIEEELGAFIQWVEKGGLEPDLTTGSNNGVKSLLNE